MCLEFRATGLPPVRLRRMVNVTLFGSRIASASLATLLLSTAACGSDASFQTDDPSVIEPVAPADAKWDLVLEDQFEGDKGTKPDENTWQAEVGTDWGNQQLEFDTDRPENIALDGQGNLVITARKEEYQGKQYSSGRLRTPAALSFQQGRFEARMKLPKGKGFWPAFWLLGANVQDGVGWPECGEIDIMEFRGQNVSEVRGSLHGPNYSGGESLHLDYKMAGDLTEDFHVYGIDWTDKGVSFFVDDHHYFSVLREKQPSTVKWVFDHPFFLILNLAVGGQYVGPVGNDAPFPAELVVDYVRVYRLANP
jgi:beta-glucanase (GH16 family)